MLYKASTAPGRDALTPNKTVRHHIAKVAKALGAGSTQRALLQFAKEEPKAFWTQLYARTIEKELSVTHEAGDSLVGLLAQSYAQAIEQPAQDAHYYIEGAATQDVLAESPETRENTDAIEP